MRQKCASQHVCASASSRRERPAPAARDDDEHDDELKPHGGLQGGRGVRGAHRYDRLDRLPNGSRVLSIASPEPIAPVSVVSPRRLKAGACEPILPECEMGVRYRPMRKCVASCQACLGVRVLNCPPRCCQSQMGHSRVLHLTTVSVHRGWSKENPHKGVSLLCARTNAKGQQSRTSLKDNWWRPRSTTQTTRFPYCLGAENPCVLPHLPHVPTVFSPTCAEPSAPLSAVWLRVAGSRAGRGARVARGGAAVLQRRGRALQVAYQNPC